LSIYLFAVFLDDLSTEINNIRAGCYIGEVLLNHLIFADDICVICPIVRGLQSILDVRQAYAESHEIIFKCSKTVCMTFKAKSAKSTVIPLLTLDGQNVKSVNHYKYLGIVLDTELPDDKDIQRQLRHQYCAANNLRASFSQCSNAVKNVLFRSFCMHHNSVARLALLGPNLRNLVPITLAGPKIFVWPFVCFLALSRINLASCKNYI